MSLTAEDVLAIKYFSIERGDPTRWALWEEKIGDIRSELPLFFLAWQNKQLADLTFRQMAEQLAEAD